MSAAATTLAEPLVIDSERSKTLRRFAFGLIVVGLLRLVPVLATPGFHNDFSHYYVGGWMYANGISAYTEPLALHGAELGIQADPRIPYAAHPPMILALFAMLSSFTPATAYWIWLVCQFAIGALFLETTRRIVGLRWNDVRWLIVVAVFCNSTCVHRLFHYSQVQLLVGSLLYIAIATHLQGKHATACAVVASAAALKIFPVVLLPWFVFAGWKCFRPWEAYRRVAAASVTIAACVAATGIRTWFDFVTIGIPNLSGHAIQWANGSVQSLVFFLSETSPWIISGNHARVIATLASLALISIAYSAIGIRRTNPREAFSVLLIAATMGGVIAWPHYMTMLLLPVALLWNSLAESNSQTRRIVGGLAGVLALMPQLNTLFFERGGESLGHVLFAFYPLYAVTIVGILLLTRNDESACATTAHPLATAKRVSLRTQH